MSYWIFKNQNWNKWNKQRKDKRYEHFKISANAAWTKNDTNYREVCQGERDDEIVGHVVEGRMLEDGENDEDVPNDGGDYDDAQHRYRYKRLPVIVLFKGQCNSG